MPYERVLSGPEGRLLYSPEFFLGISDEVFGDDVFLLRIGDDVFFLGLQISDTCGFSSATDRSAEVCSVKEMRKWSISPQKNVRNFSGSF